MRYLLILLILVITEVNAQEKKFVTINARIPIFDVKLVDIKDSVLIKQIDFCIQNEYQCRISINRNYIYALSIEYSLDNDFSIFATYTSPAILEDKPDAGIFNYNGLQYCVLGNAKHQFFTVTEKTDVLFYDMDYVYKKDYVDELGCVRMCPLIGIEENCIWEFSFKNNELKLLKTAWTDPVRND